MIRGAKSRSGTATPVIDIASPLLRAPPEIIQRIMLHCETLEDITKTAQTCQDLKCFIDEDDALWRTLLLDRYDPPRAWRESRDSSAVDWREKLKSRTLADRMISDAWDGRKKWPDLNHLAEFICETLHDVYLDISPIPKQDKHEESINTIVLNSHLKQSRFRELYSSLVTGKTLTELDATDQADPARGRRSIPPLLSKLHVLNFSPGMAKYARLTRAEQRKVTYSIENVNAAGGFGPFTPEGTVDWGLVDAYGSVMMENANDALEDSEAGWQAAAKPLSAGIDDTRGLSPVDVKRPDHLKPGEIWDWAEIHGLWRGSYAFLDYSDWVALNHPALGPQLRRRPAVDLLNYSEAVGDLQKIRFQVCANTPETLIGSLPPFTDTCATSSLLPPLFFHGVPRSRQEIQAEVEAQTGLNFDAATLDALVEHTSPTFLRGCVRLTTDDPPEVRWTWVVRYASADRWKMEGVQVGGIGSRRGIFGNWTDVERGHQSPCGPVFYWKT